MDTKKQSENYKLVLLAIHDELMRFAEDQNRMTIHMKDYLAELNEHAPPSEDNKTE